MKVLLTHGYFIHDDPAEAGIMKPYPPLGLLYLSGWLKKSGISHDLFDTTFADMVKLKTFIGNSKPGIIGLYSTLMTRFNVLEIIAYVRGSHVLQDTKIIIGGPDVRYYAENYLRENADVVVPGEGEEVLVELIESLSSRNRKSLHTIKGILFRDADGSIISTGERKPMDLNEVPFPSYDYIDVPGYLQQWKHSHGFSSMTINSMRGCPYSCNWCSKSVFGKFHRRRNPVSVVEEMIHLKDAFGPDQIWFTDDVFTISKEWLREFSNEIQKRKVILPYECITRSDCLNDEVLGLLKSSGCRKVWIGAESGSPDVIRLMNRRIDLDWTAQMMLRLKSLDISVGTFIMLGYHGEKKKDIFKTAGFLKKTIPDDLTVGVAYPIKGTKYYEVVESIFEHSYDWKSGSERQIRFKKPYSSRFYRFSGRYLFNIVAYRKAGPGLRKWVFFFKAAVSKAYIFIFN